MGNPWGESLWARGGGESPDRRRINRAGPDGKTRPSIVIKKNGVSKKSRDSGGKGSLEKPQSLSTPKSHRSAGLGTKNAGKGSYSSNSGRDACLMIGRGKT